MCILLVEDEFLIRVILAEELAEHGFAVREAENGERASRLIEAEADVFSLLVTDVHMPGALNGIGVARLMRERRPDIPVIYTTGRPNVLDALGPLGDRAAVVTKPFTPSELLGVVRRMLAIEGGEG